MKKLVLLLLAGSLLVGAGCTKTGPVGPQGPKGATGATGQNGLDGLDGNANVVGSAPFTVSTWSLSGNVYSADFSHADITPAIVDKGIVQIFKSYGTNEWTCLPDINGKTSTVFNFYDNGFTIYIQNSDGTTPANPGSQVFRVVVISASNKQAHPNTNWSNYTEAVAALSYDKTVAAQNANQ